MKYVRLFETRGSAFDCFEFSRSANMDKDAREITGSELNGVDLKWVMLGEIESNVLNANKANEDKPSLTCDKQSETKRNQMLQQIKRKQMLQLCSAPEMVLEFASQSPW